MGLITGEHAHMLFTPMLSPEKCGYMLTSNLGMKQQY